jgi:hypothetical protein
MAAEAKLNEGTGSIRVRRTSLLPFVVFLRARSSERSVHDGRTLQMTDLEKWYRPSGWQ